MPGCEHTFGHNEQMVRDNAELVEQDTVLLEFFDDQGRVRREERVHLGLLLLVECLEVRLFVTRFACK